MATRFCAEEIKMTEDSSKEVNNATKSESATYRRTLMPVP
jgi:hypothetical protein